MIEPNLRNPYCVAFRVGWQNVNLAEELLMIPRAEGYVGVLRPFKYAKKDSEISFEISHPERTKAQLQKGEHLKTQFKGWTSTNQKEMG